MIERIKRLWCRMFHHGIININSLTYECAQCFRLTYHGLHKDFRTFPTQQHSVSIKKRRRSPGKVRAIA